MYDPIADNWTNIQNFTSEVVAFPAVGLRSPTLDDGAPSEGGVFAMGGFNGGGWNETKILSGSPVDPTTQWKDLVPLPIGRWLHAAALVNDTLYAIGGLSDSGEESSVGSRQVSLG
eukprot:TRINITY_DN16089_c0_g1_i1.p1 TRINITY_DN16089_c0_g1~~TRINITY_DN16089_c0_g1_i1.p1  ORF type:complete len:116 (+),score=13.14 TRINITY_DN16089_c0_g1_i1:143-490(+)